MSEHVPQDEAHDNACRNTLNPHLPRTHGRRGEELKPCVRELDSRKHHLSDSAQIEGDDQAAYLTLSVDGTPAADALVVPQTVGDTLVDLEQSRDVVRAKLRAWAERHLGTQPWVAATDMKFMVVYPREVGLAERACNDMVSLGCPSLKLPPANVI